LKLNGKKCILRQPHIRALNELDFSWTSRYESNERHSLGASDDSSVLSSDDNDDADSSTSDDSSTSSSSVLKPSPSEVDGCDLVQGRPFKKRRVML
jgi:hypothetical protein